MIRTGFELTVPASRAAPTVRAAVSVPHEFTPRSPWFGHFTEATGHVERVVHEELEHDQ
jgi:hypothetical protein